VRPPNDPSSVELAVQLLGGAVVFMIVMSVEDSDFRVRALSRHLDVRTDRCKKTDKMGTSYVVQGLSSFSLGYSLRQRLVGYANTVFEKKTPDGDISISVSSTHVEVADDDSHVWVIFERFWRVIHVPVEMRFSGL
jgi:hypothetical protein